jgi:hypothetical protein
MTEDVPVMESTLLILVVPTKNHSKFIAPISTRSSREEWMDLRILLDAGMSMFRALVQSVENSGWDWTKSIASLQELPELN